MRGLSLAVAVLLGVSIAVACGSTPSSGSSGTSDEAGGDEILALASGPLGGEAGEARPPSDTAPTPPPANLRVAQLSPDLPAIDVCIAPHGTKNWSGPLIAQRSATAGLQGVTYSQLSAYLPVEPGQSDVLIVAAGSTSCGPSGDAALLPPDASSFPSLPVATTLPELDASVYATLVIAGELSPIGEDEGLTVAMVPDDAELAGGAASLRAINALPRGGALDFGLGSFGTKWTALFTNVAFGTASGQAGPGNGAVDSNGYLPIPPLSGDTMSARSSADATADTAIAAAVTIPLGSIATVIAVGGSASDPAHPARLLVCVDNQPAGGTLSDCSIAQ